MARRLSTLLVLVLLAATAAAFALTERLKLEPSPITATRLDRKVFSPVCECKSGVASFSFRLRKAGPLKVEIIDSANHVVKTVHDGQTPRGKVEVTWNGRTDAGVIAPEGSYRPQIQLPAQNRTIVLPNPIRLDVTTPRIRVLSVTPEQRVISPDADGRHDVLRIRYRVNEPAHALLAVNGKRVLRTLRQRAEDQLQWNGVARGGRRLPAGVYHLTVGAVDIAGNVRVEGKALTVRIRFLDLAPRTLRVKSRARFGVRVAADSLAVRWRLDGRTAIAKPPLLRLRAPARPGRYALVVSEHGHDARAVVVVRRK